MVTAKNIYKPKTSIHNDVEIGRFFNVSKNLGLNAKSSKVLRERVENGLPYKSFKTLEKKMGVSTKDLSEMLSIPKTTLSRREKEGNFKIDESDRVYRFADLLAQAIEMFGGDVKKGSLWLRKKRAIFNGHSAVIHARTELGAREVEKVIGRIRHGVSV
ncbi:MAG: DUF2384 domain-containing protein [Pseudomonadales bacterium]|nr:DUF2384 domain-containing protein [Pseudomonadales bacterium]